MNIKNFLIFKTLRQIKNPAILFLIKFSFSFLILYLGTLGIIGLSSKGGFYSPFVENYLDYISLLRLILLKSANFVCRFFGLCTSGNQQEKGKKKYTNFFQVHKY